MKALVISSYGGPEVLEVAELDTPAPASGQVSIRVAGAAVNPVDLATRSGALTQGGLLAEQPLVGIGWDVAGVVEAVGDGVDAFAPGDRVIGLRDLLSGPSAQADVVVLDATAIARAPKTVSLVEAATLPLNGLTADGALRSSGAEAGDTLLVTGAAGAVGAFVVELAAARGIRVVAVASPEDEPFLRGLGATAFVARTDALGEAVRALFPGGVDAVIDAAVLGIAAHQALRSGGTFVSVVLPFTPPALRNTTVHSFLVWADGARLAELAALVDAGRLTLRVADTLPLTDAAAAHERLAAGGVRGRLVLVP
jgi:NADPH:quinone reductase-like Zn-dependent oxidoreductase